MKNLTVRDIMTHPVVTVRENDSLETVVTLMTKHRISSLPVVDDENRVIGIVGEGDLFLKERGIPFSMVKAPSLFNQWADPQRLPEIYARARRNTAGQIMTREVRCAQAEQSVGEIAETMLRYGLTQVPVLCDGKLCGMVARADLLRLLLPSEIIAPLQKASSN
jgi:CBS domain-containing protein